MFSRFDRYMARNVIAAMLLVQFTLLILDFSISFINQLGAAQRGFGIWQILLYLCMRLPWRFYSYAPVAVLLGVLLGLGNMASHNELTAMRAAGRSLLRLLWGLFFPLLLAIALVMSIGDWLVPKAEQAANTYRITLLQGADALNYQRGSWQREGNDFYHFAAIRADGSLLGFTRYHYQDNQLISTTYAQNAYWDVNARRWDLQNVSETVFNKEQTQTQSYSHQIWQTHFDPEFLKLVIMDPHTQPISSLWRYAHYQDIQDINSNTIWLYFWQKSLQPLSLAALVLIAASFIFGPLRSVAAGTRIFYGIVVGLVFKYLQDLLAPTSLLLGFSPLWAVITPIIVCLVLGFYLLRRAN